MINQNVNFSHVITIANADGTDSMAVSCYANLTSSKTLQFTFDIVDQNIYAINKEYVKSEIVNFMDYVKAQGILNNVDLL